MAIKAEEKLWIVGYDQRVLLMPSAIMAKSGVVCVCLSYYGLRVGVLATK